MLSLGVLSQEGEGRRGVAQFTARLRPQADGLPAGAFVDVLARAAGCGAVATHVRHHAVVPGAEIINQVGSIGSRNEIPIRVCHGNAPPPARQRPTQMRHGQSLG